MSKADFYTWGKRGLDWVGSLYNQGEPWYIPVSILTQINKTTYEESVVDFLKGKKAALPERSQPWPWLWKTSEMTDYVYVFNKKMGRVVLFFEREAIDPIRIVQGHDIVNSLMPMVPTPVFPDMLKPPVVRKGKNRNGSKPPAVV
jgi:hypothetical protein